MTFNRLREIWDHPCNSPTEKFVLWALASYAGEGDRCWPSHRTIAKRTGLSQRAVQKHVAALLKRGVISIDESGGGRNQSNTYIIKARNYAPDTTNGIHRIANDVSGSENYAPRSENYAPRAHKLLVTTKELPRGRSTPKFEKDYELKIKTAEKLRTELFKRYASEHGLGTTWSDKEKHLEYIEHGKKIKEWEKSLMEL